MIKIIIAILLLSTLSGCVPLLVGTAAGVAVYNHECYRWIETRYGPQKVWVCRSRHPR